MIPELRKYDFTLVVNNAGIDLLEYYHTFEVSQIINLININSFSVCALTYKFVQLFKQKTKAGKKCAIINVASLAGIHLLN